MSRRSISPSPNDEEYDELKALGFLQRTDQQFHWQNQGYADFAAFLAALSSIKRKNLRSERAEALQDGIAVEWLTGSDITEAHWDAFFAFYMDTGSRKWGSPYLTRGFFSLIGACMPERVLLVMAKRNGRYIAGALNFIGSHALYGRNWGASSTTASFTSKSAITRRSTSPSPRGPTTPLRRRGRRQRRLPMDIVAIREMGVEIDQAGQEGRAAQVDDGGAGRHRDGGGDFGDPSPATRTIAGSRGGPPRPSMSRAALMMIVWATAAEGWASQPPTTNRTIAARRSIIAASAAECSIRRPADL